MPPRTDTAAEDALRRLEARLERASGAAERLFAEAASEAAAAAVRMGERIRPESAPAQGWQSAGAAGSESGSSRAAADLELVTALWREARGILPPEVRDRLAEAVRELLLAVRALVDWYLERLERRAATPVEVEDIPVE